MAMNKEYFWAGQLSKKKTTITWNPTIGDEDDDDSFDESAVQHFLFLKQAVLGPEAKDEERCVVQVTSENIDGEAIKQPLFSLKLGLNECTTLDVGFQPPVTFTLVHGQGPIYMSGQHALELQDDKLDDFEDEDDSDEEAVEEVDAVKMFGNEDGLKTKKRKRPMDTPSDINKKKQPKLDQSASSGKTSDDEDDDDDEDDEDFDPKAVKNDSKAIEDNDDDEEDDDDDFEDMEDDDDEDDSEDDDDDEDEEEEEEETAKVTKKNQKQKKNTKMNGKTPKAEVKTPGGGDAKAKGAQKKKGGKPQTIQEIKDDIAKSPGKPKKEMKFFNYVKNTYRVTDQQKLQDLWNWHKNTNL